MTKATESVSGVHFGEIRVSCLKYLDDVVLFTSSVLRTSRNQRTVEVNALVDKFQKDASIP